MKMLFKQRMFSWFDSYDIYDETGEVLYTVKGELAWGHLLRIYDKFDSPIGCVKQRVLTFLPKFELYENDKYLGCIHSFCIMPRKLTIWLQSVERCAAGDDDILPGMPPSPC